MPDQSSTNLSGEDTSRLLREGVPVTENSTRCDVRGVNTPLSIIYNISSKKFHLCGLLRREPVIYNDIGI